MGKANHVKKTIHTGFDVLFANFFVAQAIGHIFKGAQIRKKGVGLKHDAKIARCRWQTGGIAISEKNFSLGGLVKAGNQTQEGRFAATGWTKQADEFACLDVQVYVIEGNGFVIDLGHVFNF